MRTLAWFAYITNGNSATVSVIDTSTNTVINTIQVGATPYGVAVSPSGNRVYVANRGNGIFKYFIKLQERVSFS